MANSSKDLDRLEHRVLRSSDLKRTNVLYARMLKLDPENSLYYSKWAVLLLKQKEYQKAKQRFQRSIQISPNNVDRYDDWLEGLYSVREFEEVILLAERYPNKFEYAYNVKNTVGICYLHLGDYDNAIKSYQKAISMKEDDYGLGHFNWALALYLQGKKEEGVEMFEKAKQMNDLPVALYKREVDSLNEDLKREENKMFEDFIMSKIEGFEHFIEMERVMKEIEEGY